MINLRSEDALHKSYLNRVLMEIIDCPYLAHNLAFKGGTCAAMLGYLDRFSIDLDFDLLPTGDEHTARENLRNVILGLGLTITRELENAVFFQVRYPNEPGKRNTLKISASGIHIKANCYQVQYFSEIDRLMNSQTLETMVANKLVAVIDRFEKHKAIAGRDFYDIHYFLTHGYGLLAPILQERTGLEPSLYLVSLIQFIQQNVTQRLIDEDLNTLLTPSHFQSIRKILIPETIALLVDLQRKLQ